MNGSSGTLGVSEGGVLVTVLLACGTLQTDLMVWMETEQVEASAVVDLLTMIRGTA